MTVGYSDVQEIVAPSPKVTGGVRTAPQGVAPPGES